MKQPTGKAPRPSKTQLKRQMLELQALGEALIELPAAKLADAPLPASLREAVMLARGMKKHGALKRQKQFIGRLMRGIDAEPIAAYLAREDTQSLEAAAFFKRTEQWRDRLLHEGDEALGELVTELPVIDAARVREYVRDAADQAARGAPPKAARALFRYLRSMLESPDANGT